MIEPRFERLLQQARWLPRLLPWAAFSVACGGSSMEAPKDKDVPEIGGQANHGGQANDAGQANHGGHAAGGAAAGGNSDNGGRAGDLAGSGGAIAGAGGSAGASAGTGGAGGSGASAGSSGDSGSAGTGLGGSGGQSSICHAPTPEICGVGPIQLPRTCLSEAMASVGTALPVATCQMMCESTFAFSCMVSEVQPTSIIVQCSNACPRI